MKFQYSAKTFEGRSLTSVIDAENEKDAVSLLQKENLVLLKLSHVQEKIKEKKSLFAPKIKTEDMVLFTRQLATMAGAGLPLLQALVTLKDQVTNPTLAKVILNLIERVEAGASFSEAVAHHPKIFDELFLNMIQAGEVSGQMNKILERVASHQEDTASLKRKIKSAMMYPLVVSFMAISITLVLLIKVIPVFKDIYDDFGGELPVPTKILVSISDSLNQWFGLFFLLLIAIVVGIRFFYKTPFGRLMIDKLKLKIPIYGDLSLKIAVSRFSKTFSTLIASGVPILSALAIVSKTSGNRVIENAVEKAAKRIKEGATISEPLRESKVFPPMVLKMIGVGEKTGQLDFMLEKISEFYDDQIKSMIAGLTSIIEPVLIGFLGIVVGGIVISMFLPIFKLSTIIT